MTVYIDNVLIKMWVDETQPCLFTRMKAAPLKQSDLDDLNRQVAIAVKKLMKRHANVFSITDMTLCNNWSASEMRDVMALAAKEYKMGVTHKFFIRPQDTQARQALLQSLIAIPNIRTNVHADVASALREVEEITERFEHKRIHDRRPADFFDFLGFFKRRAEKQIITR
jgi:hypothetical protein